MKTHLQRALCVPVVGLLLLSGCSGHSDPQSESSVAQPLHNSSAQTSVKDEPSSSRVTVTSKPSPNTSISTSVTVSMPSSDKPAFSVAEPPQTTTSIQSTIPARKEVAVTVPEGYSFMQIAQLLEKKGVCTAKAFYETCQNYTPKSFTIPISDDRCFRMEGYLFPDTYRFYENDAPQDVLVKMLNNYHSKTGGISDEILILASIIEREARSETHMKLVSSVFHNRLNHSAEFPYLNADPTREYVNNYITGNSLVKDQSKYAPLYNTCGKRRGLPAGPICNPGLRAIRAAQDPTESQYYYFFYGKDAQNHYSETLQEHEQKMQEIGVG